MGRRKKQGFVESPNMKEYRIKTMSNIMSFFGLRTSPYKMDEILPFDRTGRQKRCMGCWWNCPNGRPIVVEMEQNFWSYVLFILLVADGIFLSSWYGLVDYSYSSDICIFNATQVDFYIEEYKQTIGYYEAINMSNFTGTMSRSNFLSSEAQYKSSGYEWPTPFQNEADVFTYTYGKNVSCGYYMKLCWKKKILGIPIKVCQKEWIDCQVRYVTTVNDYYFYEYQNWSSLDESISLFTDGLNYTGTFNDDTINFMTDAIFRINVASSAYAGYCALLIFIGPPVIVAKPKLAVRMMNFMNSLRKMWFVLVFLLCWYCVELWYYFFDMLAVQTDIWLMLKYATVDPCFVDTDFVQEIYVQADELCEEMVEAENAFYTYQANLDYYYQIEATYENTDGDNPYRPSQQGVTWTQRYYEPLQRVIKQNDLYYNYTCSSDTILDLIQPSGDYSDFSLANMLFTSGGIAGLFLQPCLAMFLKSLFSMSFYPSILCKRGLSVQGIVPLCPYAQYANRVLVPIPKEKTKDEMFEATMNAEIRDEIGKFICISNVLPMILSGVVVLLIVLNLAKVKIEAWDDLTGFFQDVFFVEEFEWPV